MKARRYKVRAFVTATDDRDVQPLVKAARGTLRFVTSKYARKALAEALQPFEEEG
jgi:hypothetical protein